MPALFSCTAESPGTSCMAMVQPSFWVRTRFTSSGMIDQSISLSSTVWGPL